jgi:NADH-quinone oxidoreductase subunit N
VITAAVEAGSTWLAVIAMITAVISAFLYLRITVSMYMSDPEESDADATDSAGSRRARGPQVSIPVGAGICLAVCLVVTLVVGVWPGSISGLAKDAVPALVASSP